MGTTIPLNLDELTVKFGDVVTTNALTKDGQAPSRRYGVVLDVQLDGTGKTRVADLNLPVKNKTSRITTTAEGTFRKHAMTEELIQAINSVTTNEDCYETIPEDFVREVDYSPDMVKGVADVIRDQTAARTRKMARPSTVPSTLGGKETREKDSQRNKVDELF